MQEGDRLLHPLESGSGSDQVQTAGERDFFGIPGDKSDRLTGKESGDLLVATFTKVIQIPFVDDAAFFQQVGETTCAAADFEGALKVHAGVT